MVLLMTWTHIYKKQDVLAGMVNLYVLYYMYYMDKRSDHVGEDMAGYLKLKN